MFKIVRLVVWLSLYMFGYWISRGFTPEWAYAGVFFIGFMVCTFDNFLRDLSYDAGWDQKRWP